MGWDWEYQPDIENVSYQPDFLLELHGYYEDEDSKVVTKSSLKIFTIIIEGKFTEALRYYQYIIRASGWDGCILVLGDAPKLTSTKKCYNNLGEFINPAKTTYPIECTSREEYFFENKYFNFRCNTCKKSIPNKGCGKHFIVTTKGEFETKLELYTENDLYMLSQFEETYNLEESSYPYDEHVIDGTFSIHFEKNGYTKDYKFWKVTNCHDWIFDHSCIKNGKLLQVYRPDTYSRNCFCDK